MSSRESVKRAEYLCYCTQMRERQFVEQIASGRFTSLAGLCEKTGVGMHCTACVLAVEQLYLQTVGGHAQGNGRDQTSPNSTKLSLFNLSRMLRRITPVIANRMHSVCPVLSGEGIKTVLCVSNPTHPKIRAVIRSIRVDVVLRDPAGAVRAKIRRKVHPDEHLECDLSEPFQSDLVGMPAFGSASVTLRAQGQGHQGAVRPHFKFVTAEATSAVHTVKASGKESHLLFTAPNSVQRSFVFIRNMAPGSINYSVKVGRESGTNLFTAETQLGNEACALVEIPELSDIEERLALQVVTSDQHRAFFLTGNSELTRLSADHI